MRQVRDSDRTAGEGSARSINWLSLAIAKPAGTADTRHATSALNREKTKHMKPDELADRLRTIIGDDPNVGEIRMFGGICFTLNGNMLVGTMKDGTLLVRVGDDQEATALAQRGASR